MPTCVVATIVIEDCHATTALDSWANEPRARATQIAAGSLDSYRVLLMLPSAALATQVMHEHYAIRFGADPQRSHLDPSPCPPQGPEMPRAEQSIASQSSDIDRA